MVDSEESLEIMQRVRKLGVRFAIDDFGTGFSNMGYITRFAVDRIKIDRSFISRCDVDENSRAVTAAIIALAHSLQIEVIAEGVESDATCPDAPPDGLRSGARLLLFASAETG